MVEQRQEMRGLGFTLANKVKICEKWGIMGAVQKLWEFLLSNEIYGIWDLIKEPSS